MNSGRHARVDQPRRPTKHLDGCGRPADQTSSATAASTCRHLAADHHAGVGTEHQQTLRDTCRSGGDAPGLLERHPQRSPAAAALALMTRLSSMSAEVPRDARRPAALSSSRSDLPSRSRAGDDRGASGMGRRGPSKSHDGRDGSGSRLCARIWLLSKHHARQRISGEASATATNGSARLPPRGVAVGPRSTARSRARHSPATSRASSACRAHGRARRGDREFRGLQRREHKAPSAAIARARAARGASRRAPRRDLQQVELPVRSQAARVVVDFAASTWQTSRATAMIRGRIVYPLGRARARPQPALAGRHASLGAAVASALRAAILAPRRRGARLSVAGTAFAGRSRRVTPPLLRGRPLPTAVRSASRAQRGTRIHVAPCTPGRVDFSTHSPSSETTSTPRRPREALVLRLDDAVGDRTATRRSELPPAITIQSADDVGHAAHVDKCARRREVLQRRRARAATICSCGGDVNRVKWRRPIWAACSERGQAGSGAVGAGLRAASAAGLDHHLLAKAGPAYAERGYNASPFPRG